MKRIHLETVKKWFQAQKKNMNKFTSHLISAPTPPIIARNLQSKTQKRRQKAKPTQMRQAKNNNNKKHNKQDNKTKQNKTKQIENKSKTPAGQGLKTQPFRET